ncbi:MBL fold metallo-hydrolase [Malonomonas rubra]|uniref:MBL fold metallo-hydrolase n=1 Tax=Malonomonas rubra TaxID=57040 RepID=UPI0026F0248B|nr:MBL fold metallo-hydrolase [Malonomonas rubra]
MGSSFKILGSGAGPGVPSFFCECRGCREARLDGRHCRTRSGALLRTDARSYLIDTSPDLRFQLLQEQLDSIDGIFLTHWHYDHFGGLGEMEYYVKLDRKEPIPLYLPPTAVDSFRAAFTYLQDILDPQPWEFATTYNLGHLGITPLPANHGVETAGFLIESEKAKLAYFPDTSGLPEATKVKMNAIDWLICDATFSDFNWFPDSHMSMSEAIELGQSVGAKKTVLTHMAIHYSKPVTVAELECRLTDVPNVLLAYDGMQFNLLRGVR